MYPAISVTDRKPVKVDPELLYFWMMPGLDGLVPIVHLPDKPQLRHQDRTVLDSNTEPQRHSYTKATIQLVQLTTSDPEMQLHGK